MIEGAILAAVLAISRTIQAIQSPEKPRAADDPGNAIISIQDMEMRIVASGLLSPHREVFEASTKRVLELITDQTSFSAEAAPCD